MAKTVTVHCGLASGLRLTVTNPKDVTTAAHVTVHEGTNPGVDKAFWDQWVDENADYGPFKNGLLSGVDDEDEEPEDDPDEPKPVRKPAPYRKN